ncbi:kinase-like domain-containing protein [Gorgonomyces haynaldii]|nr:kinase-like domain-containing protein [Gorgonomyces haynaldii]
MHSNSVHQVPKYISSSILEQEMILLISDLEPQFHLQFEEFQLDQLFRILDWLAQFHAQFWNQEHGLHTNGTYWYLETRMDEWNRIPKKYQILKDNAQKIAERCSDARYCTLVHGDLKSENILWSDDGLCAFYDFQYTGSGLGAKDIVYLLVSSAERPALDQIQRLLRFYFDRLLLFLNRDGKSTDYNFQMFETHFDWCLLDYCRFLSGWGIWGHFDWALNRSKHLL